MGRGIFKTTMLFHLDTLRIILVSKLTQRTIVSELDSHWVPMLQDPY